MSHSREASMSYLKDFRERIANDDFPGFIKLWEEYCYGDQPDGEELILILQDVKKSSMAKNFGLHVERVLTLWREIKDSDLAHKSLSLIFDLETTNNDELADLATQHLKDRFPNDPLFLEKIRLVGLRNREQFQGCVRQFDLLTHMKKGNYVFHSAGWGTGEILDVSLVREELSLDFEYVIGAQHLSFEKAFKTLIPLSPEHFYSRRFGNADKLEIDAKENPSEIIRMILRDLGPKTASDIKDELYDLVIPANDWNRWWQTARSKIKKDTKIEFPHSLKDPFRLREEEVPHEIALHKALEGNPSIDASIQMIYTFLRDFPETLKNKEFKSSIDVRLKSMLSHSSLNSSQRLQILFFQDDLGLPHAQKDLVDQVVNTSDVGELIQNIDVIAFQKRLLQLVRKHRKDWSAIFLSLFFSIGSHQLRDYLLQELNSEQTRAELTHQLNSLLIHPITYPEIFVWYFQKLLDTKRSQLPFSDPSGQNQFFEGFLILLAFLGQNHEHRELAKKIVSLITASRYKVVRDIMQHSSVEEVKEYLLLATKCQTFSDHDIKILYSLAEVAHPSLTQLRKEKTTKSSDDLTLWTSQAGYQKLQQRIQEIATTETVQNAREIETARSHGDLRENAEFKAALERRDRLQTELKFLSDQFARARILLPIDVPADEVGIGSVVICRDSKGEKTTFTILGPWDADPEKRILSFQSKLAIAMLGRSVGEKFEFQSEQFTISDINSFFEQQNNSSAES